jgi:hypothetical protein
VVTADASLKHLVPLLVHQVGDGTLDPDNPRWALYDEAGRPLSTASLTEQGIVDGDVLRLSGSGTPGGADLEPVRRSALDLTESR